jgi:UDP-glucuronate 4-epimerase
VTGAAGFIGFHLSQYLIRQGQTVVGLDNLNDYYDPQLKRDRLAQLSDRPSFTFEPVDLGDREALTQVFETYRPEKVVNLAAQAGVRYSIENPHAYVDANLVGFVNLLECCRHFSVQHLVYASSSSVYGANRKIPFSVDDNVDHPISLYAATKKANELIAHTYSHLYRLPTTGLRFFTVYGSWGRPDMAYFLFTKAILEKRPIKVFNHGNMRRDFTYIDDVVLGITRVMDHIPQPADPSQPSSTDSGTTAPYVIHNIGNHTPVPLLRFIEVLEASLGQTAIKEFLPMQPGDVPETYADVRSLVEAVGFQASTPIEVGIPRFVQWYREYYDL